MRIKTKVAKRNLYGEMMAGVRAMKAHREGLLTLRSHTVEPLSVPAISAKLVLDTRSAFHMSRHVFARTIGVNPRTLERWCVKEGSVLYDGTMENEAPDQSAASLYR